MVFDNCLNISNITITFTATLTRNSTMTKSLKQVIEALLSQGYTKTQVLDTLASEYWVDQSVTRFLASV
jgi:cytochrome c-type biogenesis protein CcmH/NrfF